MSSNFVEAISNSTLWLSILRILNDRESRGRFTCDEYKTKNLEENNNLKSIRSGNLNSLVLAHLNINFFRNKFGILT